MDHDKALEQAKAVERGDLPSGSVVLPITGPNSMATPGRRYCFHADESYTEDGMYLVIKVVEDEAGYTVWGQDSDAESAKTAAQTFNTRLGLTDEDVINIRLSSMRASAGPIFGGTDGTEERYGWWGWAEETENENDDDREGVYYLTITDGGEEMAVIMHRIVGGKYPIDGEVANEKVERAKRIVDALNGTVTVEEPAAPEVIVMRVLAGEDPDDPEWAYDVVVCPITDCLSTEFYEVDEATRWNPMELDEKPQPAVVQQYVGYDNGRPVWNDIPNEHVDMPKFLVSEQKHSDGYSTDRHICQSCNFEVTLPEWLETEWCS